MASQERVEQFIKKMKFMYIETPPELDNDYEHFATLTDKEYTEEKRVEQEKNIREAFAYYGDNGINWILAQRPAVKTAIITDTVFINMYNKSNDTQERKNILQYFSP